MSLNSQNVYVKMKDNEIGTYTLNQVRNLRQSGTVTAGALFRYEGQETWESISKIIDTTESVVNTIELQNKDETSISNTSTHKFWTYFFIILPRNWTIL